MTSTRDHGEVAHKLKNPSEFRDGRFDWTHHHVVSDLPKLPPCASNRKPHLDPIGMIWNISVRFSEIR